MGQRGTRLEVEIKAADKRTGQVYGAEKLQHDLVEHGIRAGICRIKRIRRKLGIRCKQKRKFKAITDFKHNLPVAENILGQQFKVTAPNKVWVSDITYVRLTKVGCILPPIRISSPLIFLDMPWENA